MTPNEQTAVGACPHCGCHDRDQDEGQPMVELDNEDVTGRWFVVCHGCGARSGLFFESANAVEAWNRRALLEASPTVPVSRWIPVTERLPEEETLVLCFVSEGHVYTGFRRGGQWQFVIPGMYCYYEGATHWQPLDEAPQ